MQGKNAGNSYRQDGGAKQHPRTANLVGQHCLFQRLKSSDVVISDIFSRNLKKASAEIRGELSERMPG